MTTEMVTTPVLTIDGYEGARLVGHGGSSVVYRASQTRFDRTVAVKVVHRSALDEAAREAFTRECTTAGRVSRHPHIVTVLDGGVTPDGRPFLVCDYMEGGTLADRLADGRRLSVAEALDLGVKLCGALATVHAAGILHNDVKPENVLYSDYGEPHLTDFGISALRDADLAADAVALTPSHAAPERWQAGAVTAAADLYSLGSTLYAALAGHGPHDHSEADLGELVRRSLHDEIRPLPVDVAPAGVDEVIRHALERAPEDRYRDAVAFARALQAQQVALGLRRTPLTVPAGLGVEPEDDDELLGGALPGTGATNRLWARRALWAALALAMLVLGLSLGRAVQNQRETATGEPGTVTAEALRPDDPSTTRADGGSPAPPATLPDGSPAPTTTGVPGVTPAGPPATLPDGSPAPTTTAAPGTPGASSTTTSANPGGSPTMTAGPGGSPTTASTGGARPTTPTTAKPAPTTTWNGKTVEASVDNGSVAAVGVVRMTVTNQSNRPAAFSLAGENGLGGTCGRTLAAFEATTCEFYKTGALAVAGRIAGTLDGRAYSTQVSLTL